MKGNSPLLMLVALMAVFCLTLFWRSVIFNVAVTIFSTYYKFILLLFSGSRGRNALVFFYKKIM